MRTFDRQLNIQGNTKCGEQIEEVALPQAYLDDNSDAEEKNKKKYHHKIPIRCAEKIDNNWANPEEAKWGRFWVQIQQGEHGGGQSKGTIQYFELIFYGKSK